MDRMIFEALNEAVFQMFSEQEEALVIEKKETELARYKEIKEQVQKYSADDRKYRSELNKRLQREKEKFHDNYGR